MKKIVTTLGENLLFMLIVVIVGICFIILAAARLIFQLFKHKDRDEGEYRLEPGELYLKPYMEDEDSYYDQTKLELRLENRRLYEDLEEEKKHSNHITTVKNTLLNENAEQKQRIEGLCNAIDFKSSEIMSYEEALEIKNNSLAAIELEVERLESFIDMAAKDANLEGETAERSAEFYKNYVHGENENNKMGKTNKSALTVEAEAAI